MIETPWYIYELQDALLSPDTADPDTISDAAAEYAKACAAVNERLRKIAPFLGRGPRSEVVQLTEIEPHLLELVVELDFPEREDWCQLLKSWNREPPPPLLLDLLIRLQRQLCDERAVYPEDRVLTKEIAEMFMTSGSPWLDVFTVIEDDAAESLSKHEGSILPLNGLTELSDAAAKSLGKYKGYLLDLNGLTSLSDAAAQSLSQHASTGGGHASFQARTGLPSNLGSKLFLMGLTELSDAAAKSLSKYEGELNLQGAAAVAAGAAYRNTPLSFNERCTCCVLLAGISLTVVLGVLVVKRSWDIAGLVLFVLALFLFCLWLARLKRSWKLFTRNNDRLKRL